MRKTSVFVTIAFLAGLGVGFLGRGAYEDMLQRRTHAADVAAIEKLHQEDIEVTLSLDPKGLIDVWAEDGVRLEPGKPPVVGKQAIQADNEKGHVQVPGFKVLSYDPHLKNIHVHIADGWAYEWGENDAKFQMSPETPPVSMHGKGVRVLERQSDGSWKFAVVCGNQ